MQTYFTLWGIALLIPLVIIAKQRRRSLPDSLSQCAYLVDPRAFSVSIVTAALNHSAALALIAIKEWQTPLSFLYFVGMCLVAISPHYKTHDKALHFAGAYLSAAALIIICAATHPLTLLVWLLYLPLLIKKQPYNTLAAEAICAMQLLTAAILTNVA